MLTIYPEKDRPGAAAFCEAFLNKPSLPRFILGRNEYAASIAQYVDVNGFIDEFTNETNYLGKPILKLDEIPKESLVVSVVLLGRPLIALQKLKNHGTSCLDYLSFMKYSGLDIKRIELFSDSTVDVEKNWSKYQWIYNQLSDEPSKDILNRLLNFRISGNLDYMCGFKHAPENQYFETLLEFNPGEVFIDAGGFDGQTTIEFIKRCPDYKSVHFFEPDPLNLATARKNLIAYNYIYYYPTGLAESKKILKLDSGGGSSSKICDSGDLEVHVDSIDNLISEPITFIKMDIEGSEGMALQGSNSHIHNDHPKLAICCYHKHDDLWRIPESILKIRDDYSIYLRHYTEGFTESVMYFVPKM